MAFAINSNWPEVYWTRSYWPLYGWGSSFITLPSLTTPTWTSVSVTSRTKYIPVVPRLEGRDWPTVTRETQDFLRAVKAAAEAASNVQGDIGEVIGDVQAYIDVLVAFLDLLIDYLGVLPASEIHYDNLASDLLATNVQAAIDEIVALFPHYSLNGHSHPHTHNRQDIRGLETEFVLASQIFGG